MKVHGQFDPQTNTITYIVWDEVTRDAVIIDPVLDFDAAAISVSRGSIERVLEFVERHKLAVHYVLETHVHADHLSGSLLLKERLGAKMAISSHVQGVQRVFGPLFRWQAVPLDGSQWDVLLEDGSAIQAGSMAVLPMHVPGHTPACMAFCIGGVVFTGDALFMPDVGTGRCDFPGGSAEMLFDSVQHRLYTLPDDTRVFVAHDYPPATREVTYETTIGASKASNIHLRADTTREDFVAFRKARDATLKPPQLIFQSLQVNARAGRLPDPGPDGRRHLTLPMGVFD